MHISEGVLTLPTLAAGWAATGAGVWLGLRRLPSKSLVSAGILSAAFYLASLIHVPIGPSSVHLILNGLVGLLLGWAAYPVILVGLTLHALMFQFGGLTVLGVNTTIMALPAVAGHLLFARLACGTGPRADAAAFACGALAVGLAAALAGLALALAGEAFLPAAYTLAAAHLPVMVIEGLLTALTLRFLKRVKPELLPA
jgi:cobalt/nickel transport system permease protein